MNINHIATRARTLHLVDIENLVGTPNPARGDVRVIDNQFRCVANVQPGDHVVVASSHHCAPVVWFECPADVRRLVRSGPDGADRALLRVLAEESVVSRYERVVIGSGDGIFAESAAGLQQSGVEVAVVARPSGLSRRLAFAARDIRFIEAPPVLAEVTVLRRAA